MRISFFFRWQLWGPYGQRPHTLAQQLPHPPPENRRAATLGSRSKSDITIPAGKIKKPLPGTHLHRFESPPRIPGPHNPKLFHPVIQSGWFYPEGFRGTPLPPDTPAAAFQYPLDVQPLDLSQCF